MIRKPESLPVSLSETCMGEFLKARLVIFAGFLLDVIRIYINEDELKFHKYTCKGIVSSLFLNSLTAMTGG